MAEILYYDNLIAGDYPRVTEVGTLLSGETVDRGDLLGKVTASGKYVLSLAASTDGSEVPVAIASDTADASLGDVPVTLYLSGEFSEDHVGFGTGHTAASVRDGLRALNIYLKDTVQSPTQPV